jgi:DNA/RNA endonuclease G (NUC1)
VEKLTGYDFFSNLPKEVQQIIEEKVDRLTIASLPE